MSLETETKTEEEIDTSNIFEEFNDDSELKKEVKGMVDYQEKDIFYYLSIVGKFAQNTFWILLLLLAFLYGYIFIQENENIKDSNILDPFCVIFLWNIENTNTFCSSVTSLHKEYEYGTILANVYSYLYSNYSDTLSPETLDNEKAMQCLDSSFFYANKESDVSFIKEYYFKKG